jgi:predicted RNase H-like nuclease (RuvC/YqgF family)
MSTFEALSQLNDEYEKGEAYKVKIGNKKFLAILLFIGTEKEAENYCTKHSTYTTKPSLKAKIDKGPTSTAAKNHAQANTEASEIEILKSEVTCLKEQLKTEQQQRIHDQEQHRRDQQRDQRQIEELRMQLAEANTNYSSSSKKSLKYYSN